MKFVLIFGPQAVGKMTVGHELEKITDLKLFHNHMTIELVNPFFDYGTKEGKRLVGLFREELFKAMAKSDQSGMIFTYVWAFDIKEDWEYVEKVCQLFESEGGSVYLVELEADLEERLVRNRSAYRLEEKPSKRNIERSENDLLKSKDQYRLNSYEGEIQRANYIRIKNTNLTAAEVARRVRDHFEL
ncbi:AAA family ATPase [Bacillus sp. ISL-35]|uniref:AAA family ATPase n=1 Tax=Bacillus sp. ISL-35 TaxID=2819122 RepID=UPI001BE6BC53|nr:AAA family ATPase [Bacillus sp. ISL-35]MBT2680204.1 AAA family ATPase [Bacillus sp. ISL-35]MBT2704480.1 AAA family ATPase [Chryseobacterium sp. ISL-80]